MKDQELVKALREHAEWARANEWETPITLGDLRQMPIRDWVWIEILNPDAFRSKETVSAYYRKYDGYKKDEIFWCGYPGLGFGFDYADYGKAWLSYRQKPEEDCMKNIKCRNCFFYRNEWCEKIVDSPDPEKARDCNYFREMTKADRIRAMSDEELNELFHEIYNAGAEDAVAYEWGQRTNSFEWTMDWLKQPAEGE